MIVVQGGLYVLLIVGAVTESTALTVIAGILFLLVVLATFLPSLAVAVRRLHDTDKSG